MGVAAAIIGGVLSVAGSVSQAKAQKKAAKAQRRAQEAAQKRADIQAQRERVQAVRQARIRRGQVAAGAANSGTTATSGAVGAQSSISSQLTGNLGFSAQQQRISGQISGFNIQAAEAQSQAATFGAIGGIGSTIFNDAGGFKTIFKEFG